MNVDVFYKFPSELMGCSGFIDKTTGEVVKLTPLAKNVYVYMLSRNHFFTDKLSSQHYETQQTIADACGSEYQVVGRVLRLFMDHGVIEAVKLRPNGVGQWRWFYRKVCTDIVLFHETRKNKSLDTKETVVQDTSIVDDLGYSDDFLSGIVWE